MSINTPTTETYTGLQKAYDFFNEHLFNGTLPNCLITLQRQKRTFGYFSPRRFVNSDGKMTDEIALNPSYFSIVPVVDSLSTLVHEQAHLWQAHFGKPSIRTYHNKEWSIKMESLGLIPSDTGMPNGKKTGQKVSHYIDQDGKFLKACTELLTEDFIIGWFDRFPPRDINEDTIHTLSLNLSDDTKAILINVFEEKGLVTPEKGRLINPQVSFGDKYKWKYSCPKCLLNAWGKPDLLLICGKCDQELISDSVSN